MYSDGFTAVKNVTVKLYQGQIFALLGHNGAGKTTSLNMLFGMIAPTKGNAKVYGLDIINEM